MKSILSFSGAIFVVFALIFTSLKYCGCNNNILVKCTEDNEEVYSQVVKRLSRGELAWSVTELDGTHRTLRYANCTWRYVPKK